MKMNEPDNNECLSVYDYISHIKMTKTDDNDRIDDFDGKENVLRWRFNEFEKYS